MKPMTAEWVAKAEGDFTMMERECQVTENPNYDGICFHAQQCTEKYLKARLCEVEITFSKIHDLVALLNQVLEVEPKWESFHENLAYLSDFAVTFRYPGESADAESQSMPSVDAFDFVMQPAMHWDYRHKIIKDKVNG